MGEKGFIVILEAGKTISKIGDAYICIGENGFIFIPEGDSW
jgi:hypothetical protein